MTTKPANISGRKAAINRKQRSKKLLREEIQQRLVKDEFIEENMSEEEMLI